MTGNEEDDDDIAQEIKDYKDESIISIVGEDKTRVFGTAVKDFMRSKITLDIATAEFINSSIRDEAQRKKVKKHAQQEFFYGLLSLPGKESDFELYYNPPQTDEGRHLRILLHKKCHRIWMKVLKACTTACYRYYNCITISTSILFIIIAVIASIKYYDYHYYFNHYYNGYCFLYLFSSFLIRLFVC
jgi:hypothetical protein